MKKLLLPLFLFFCISSFCQTAKFTISGFVHEKGSKELLPGVNVYAPRQKAGTVTNNYGFYSLTLPSDTIELTFSFIGYTTKKMKFFLDKDIQINIEDMEGTTILKEVEVNTSQTEKISDNTQMSTIDIPVEQIKDIPALLG